MRRNRLKYEFPFMVHPPSTPPEQEPQQQPEVQHRQIAPRRESRRWGGAHKQPNRLVQPFPRLGVPVVSGAVGGQQRIRG